MSDTPIYSALKEYLGENSLRLHMPGHIGGKGIIAPELQIIAQMDVTEIPGLDDLHLPEGIIDEARRRMARAFGAAESFFLVNGATSGIHTLIMSVSADDDEIMVPRNAHRSVYGAMVLSGARPVYIPCSPEPELGLALTVTAGQIDRLLEEHPGVRAVFITSPSYYGSCCDIAAIAGVTGKWGKELLVDEAHGGHFPFHPAFPAPALGEGAAAAVNGLHKTLPVLNQGACLHLAPNFSGRQRLLSVYSLLTTTSPSYPILASMDLARSFMETEGRQLLARSRDLSCQFKRKIDKIKGIKDYSQKLLAIDGVKEIDPLKVLISLPELALTGYEAARLLRSRYHIQVEAAGDQYILAMFSMFHDEDDWDRFYKALQALAGDYYSGPAVRRRLENPPWPKMVLSPRQSLMAVKKSFKLEEAIGMIAGEMVAVYPPGVPCLLPGELISREMVEYITGLKNTGAHIHGPLDPALTTILVIEP